MTLEISAARTLVDDARARGFELGKALSIAVVDYGGFPVLLERMDGARPLTPSIALSKEAIVAAAGFATDFPAWAGAKDTSRG